MKWQTHTRSYLQNFCFYRSWHKPNWFGQERLLMVITHANTDSRDAKRFSPWAVCQYVHNRSFWQIEVK